MRRNGRTVEELPISRTAQDGESIDEVIAFRHRDEATSYRYLHCILPRLALLLHMHYYLLCRHAARQDIQCFLNLTSGNERQLKQTAMLVRLHFPDHSLPAGAAALLGMTHLPAL